MKPSAMSAMNRWHFALLLVVCLCLAAGAAVGRDAPVGPAPLTDAEGLYWAAFARLDKIRCYVVSEKKSQWKTRRTRKARAAYSSVAGRFERLKLSADEKAKLHVVKTVEDGKLARCEVCNLLRGLFSFDAATAFQEDLAKRGGPPELVSTDSEGKPWKPVLEMQDYGWYKQHELVVGASCEILLRGMRGIVKYVDDRGWKSLVCPCVVRQTDADGRPLPGEPSQVGLNVKCAH